MIMRFINVYVLLVLLLISGNVFAKNQETNVDVTLEIEGEYKFEPFKQESLGLAGLLKNGFLRVIKESDTGLSKYAALNDAMQKARRDVWSVILESKISNNMDVRQAVLDAPTYIEYKEKDEEKAKLAAMKKSDRDAFIKKHGKEKKYDLDKVLDVIKECGSYKNSGRFYDAVEQKGYACLEVKLDDFFNAVDNDKINIFANLKYGEKYKPMDTTPHSYDGVIIDATDTDFVPSLFLRVLSPTEETVYAGVAGKKKIFYAKDIEDAKVILGSEGARKVYNTQAQGTSGAVGLIISLKGSDRIFSTIAKNNTIPFVIIYKNQIDNPISAGGE